MSGSAPAWATEATGPISTSSRLLRRGAMSKRSRSRFDAWHLNPKLPGIMGPVAMLAILVGALAAFAWSASRRWQLLRVGRPEYRFDRVGERLRHVWRYAFVQQKMDYYQPAGIAHKFIFIGFSVLLLRSIMLWGRG